MEVVQVVFDKIREVINIIIDFFKGLFADLGGAADEESTTVA